MKKVLVIGFLFGAFVSPFIFSIGLAIPGWQRTAPLFIPGNYIKKPILEYVLTVSPASPTVRGNPATLSDLMKKALVLGRTIMLLANGIFYALIFWIIYFLVRKLRNKEPI